MRRADPNGRVWFLSQSCNEWYYTGMRRAVPVETPQPDVRSFDKFDFVLTAKKDNQRENEILAARGDLVEIPLSGDSTVRLFRKIRKK